MSERAFGVVLAIVILVWGIFVLVPSAAEALPRVWQTVQYILPGDAPTVVVAVKDVAGKAVEGARVQIIQERETLTALTDKNGQVVLTGVPAGRALQIRVQKVDYAIRVTADATIPHRQRARFSYVLSTDLARRLYVGHETGKDTIAIDLIDPASRIPLTAPGSSGEWENVPATAIQTNAVTQRLYVLAGDRLTIMGLQDGSVVQTFLLPGTGGGMTVSASGDIVYVFTVGATEGQRWLLAIEPRSRTARYQIQVQTSATRAAIAATSDGRRVYVAGINDNTIMAYENPSGRRVATYRMPGPIQDMTLSNSNQPLYALLADRPIPLAVDVAGNGAVTPVLDSAPGSLLDGATSIVYAEAQVHKTLAVLTPAADRVALIDLIGRDVYTVDVGREPSALLAFPYAGELYVANKGSSSLSVVSLITNKLLDTIDVRSKPALLTAP